MTCGVQAQMLSVAETGWENLDSLGPSQGRDGTVRVVPLQPRAGRLEGSCDPGTLKWRLGQALGEHSGCWKGHCGLHCTDLRGLLVSDGSGLGGHRVVTPRAAPEASVHQLTALAGTSGTSSLAWGPSEVSGRVGTILNIDRRPLCSPPCTDLG